MATLAKKIEVEKAAREMLADNDLPPPDRIEYGFTCIRLIWNDLKTCVVIDIDDPPDEEVRLG